MNDGNDGSVYAGAAQVEIEYPADLVARLTIRQRLIEARKENAQIHLIVLRGGVALELTGPAAVTN